MAKLYITEYTEILPSGVPASRPLAEQQITIGATANLSAAFGLNTRAVRLQADAPCSYTTSGADATTSCARMSGNAPAEYARVVPGGRMSVIANT